MIIQLLRRESYKDLPIQANYFPMPTGAFLQDASRRITIVSDVQHGVTANAETGLEIMLGRRATR